MSDEVLFSQEGGLGCITLNRPKALHALTLAMICSIQKQLEVWKRDADIHALLITATASPAFCAGGDVRWLYETGKAQNPEQSQFFWNEYRLNHAIHQLGKPYIALMDGITMGGGVGIALHGSHPVATENFSFAMPETGIGFFPDIGASYLLNRCPGHLGLYLGLTGNKLNAAEALQAGLIKQVVPSDKLPLLVEALKAEDLSHNAFAKVDACLQGYAHSSERAKLLPPELDACFSCSVVEAIKQALQRAGSAWALDTYQILEKKSPTSLKVSLAQLHKAKGLTLADCLQMDYNLAEHFMRGADFYEGVRAALIDKDKTPAWQPASLEAVSEAMVIQYFEDRGSLGLC